MQFFEGWLDQHEVKGSCLFLRFAPGDFDPAPLDLPILETTIEHVEDLEAVLTALAAADVFERGCYFERCSDTEVRLTSDEGAELLIRGRSVEVCAAPYGGRDFERLAKWNHELTLALRGEAHEQSERNHRALELLHDQCARLKTKLERHDLGTTAHTLYQQHLDFAGRLIDVLRPEGR